MLWVYGRYNLLILSMRGPSLNVTSRREILTSIDGPRAVP